MAVDSVEADVLDVVFRVTILCGDTVNFDCEGSRSIEGFRIRWLKVVMWDLEPSWLGSRWGTNEAGFSGWRWL